MLHPSPQARGDVTFAYRRTHAAPERLPEAPSAWEQPYSAMATEDRLPWKTLGEVTSAAKAFLNPVLAGSEARWDPAGRRWG